jgi:hypothetical protein
VAWRISCAFSRVESHRGVQVRNKELIYRDKFTPVARRLYAARHIFAPKIALAAYFRTQDCLRTHSWKALNGPAVRMQTEP